MLLKGVFSKSANVFLTQDTLLGYRIDWYFRDDIFATETDENNHSKININYEIKLQKSIDQEFGCAFTATDPDKDDFHIFKAINKIFRNIK